MPQFLEYIEQIKSFLKITTLVLLYGLTSVLGWSVTGNLGFSFNTQVLLVALILLTFPIALFIKHYFKKSEDQIFPVTNNSSTTKDYPDLINRAEEVVQWLNNTKLASKSTKKVVYQLPWFLLLGAKSSGKTSLILNSGLDIQALPSQQSLSQNLFRPTNSCEWYVSNSAVFIDTAGRYLNEGTDHEEWLSLLNTIKRYRPERPIDGLILTVETTNITKASENEIEQQAKQLRARIDELKAQFNSPYPIYLVFTHADVINGFEVFFSNFDKKTRNQIWGTTIPLEQREQAYSLFDEEFSYLCEALMSNRLVHLASSNLSKEQLEIFDFPFCFASIKNKLSLFVSTLFRPSPFTDNPWLRGFYFIASSVIKKRPSENLLITAQEYREKYFIDDLIQEQLLNDTNLSASMIKKTDTPKLKRRVLIATVSFISLFLIIGFTVSLIRNRSLINESLEKGLRVDEISRLRSSNISSNQDTASLRVELEAVEQLRQQLVVLENYKKSRPLSYSYGLYSGNDINPNLRAIYFDLLNQHFFQQTAENLENDLRKFADSKNKFSEEELGYYYDLLKTYLMLSEPNKTEPTFLANRLNEYWKKSYPPELELLAQQQLDFYAKQAIYDDAPHLKADDKIVSASRQHLVSYPAVNRFFKRVTSEIDLKVKPVTVESITQGRNKGGLIGKYSVPGSFTIEGYEGYMNKALVLAEAEMNKEDWVMGASTVTTKDLSSDVGKLEGIYFHEYSKQWQNFLKGLSIPAFKTKEDAIEALKILSANDSPLDLTLTEVARQTNFTGAKAKLSWWKKIFASKSITPNPQILELEKEFLALRQFLEQEGENSPVLQYRSSLRIVLDNLETSTADQLSQTTKMLLTGKDDIGLQKAELTINKLLESFTSSATRDAASACKQPLGNLRAMLYGSSYVQIEQSWQEQIYPKARNIEQGFPFTETGSASITDLTRYLNPVNGVLAQFFNDRLAPSFEEVGGKLQLKESGAFKFSQEFISYLNTSKQLREALFAQGGQQMEVSYELLLQPTANTDVVIEIDGTRVETRGTTVQSAKFTWPAKSGASGAKITVIQGNKIAEKAFPGEWGLFKMVTGATPEGNLLILSWNIEGIPIRATLRPSSANNAFSRHLFTQWHAPKNLRN
ncbi:MAG: type VI secretion system membrane subunit TssM [Acidobacteria bacterium]|nr:type VI secretion system membrane subunit TssM [Acidobacteriota bacterium]